MDNKCFKRFKGVCADAFCGYYSPSINRFNCRFFAGLKILFVRQLVMVLNAISF